MTRNILMGRTDWIREPGVTFTPNRAAWPLSLTRLADINPQYVAEADGHDPLDTKFTVNLGYPRKIGAIHFANLRTGIAGLMQVVCKLAGVTTYDTGVVASWPQDTPIASYNPWGIFTFSGRIDSDFYTALGFTRVFVPSSNIFADTIEVSINDVTLTDPLQIGCLGAYETWEPPYNFAYDWSIEILDDSVINRLRGGAVYITKANKRRRMNFGFSAIAEDEILARELDLMLVKGRSDPLLIVPFPDDTGNIEKTSIYGLITGSSLSNPFIGYYRSTFQVEQIN